MDDIDWPLFMGLGGAILGLLFFYWHQQANHHLWLLQKLKEYHVDNELHEKVKAAGGRLSYAAVTGNISADERVIHGIHNREAEGVMRNVKTNEHKSKWDPKTKSWCENIQQVSTEWEVTSFSLIPRDLREGERHTARVNVKDPRSAHNKLDLSTIADKYKPASTPGLFGRIGNYFGGQSVTGIQTIEEMLLKNTRCTVVGELRLAGDKLVITPPCSGSLQYYIFPNTYGGCVERILDKEKLVLNENWKYFAIHCFMFASLFLVTWLIKCLGKYSDAGGYTRFLVNEGWNVFVYFHFWIVAGFILCCLLGNYETMDFVNENTDTASSKPDADEVAQHVETLDFGVASTDRTGHAHDPTVCSICLVKSRNVVFLPCGHVCSCSECSRKVKCCPICRRPIINRTVVFFS